MSSNDDVDQISDSEIEATADAAASFNPPPPTPEVWQSTFAAAINEDKPDAFADLVTSDCVEHDPALGQVRGPAGYAHLFATMRRSFPDLHVEADHVVATADEICLAYTLTGTHTGADYEGRAAKGDGINVRGMQIARIVDGKMVERWGSSDELSIRRQLGMLE